MQNQKIIHNPIRIIVADDDINFLTLIKKSLAKEKKWNLVDTAYDGKELFLKVEKHKPHLILIDIEMPLMGGIEAAKLIKEVFPYILMVGLSSHNDPAKIKAILDAGACGYIDKSVIWAELHLAIECVLSGNDYVSKCANIKRKINYVNPVLFDNLKEIDLQIMRLIAHGLTAIEIGKKVNLSDRTIETHVSKLKQKFGINNAAEFGKFIAQNLM